MIAECGMRIADCEQKAEFRLLFRNLLRSGASQTRFFFFPNFVASNYLSNQREQSIFLEDGTIEIDATGTDTFTNFRSWTFNTGLGLGLEFHVSRRIDISFMANLNITLNTLHKDKEHEIAAGCGCLNLNLDYRL